MLSATAPIMMLAGCGIENTHGFLAAAAPTGDKAICGVFSSAATSVMAVAAGTLLEPMIRSTLSSTISLRASLTALVGSVASSITTYWTGWPPRVLGTTVNVFLYGMPRDAPG